MADQTTMTIHDDVIAFFDELKMKRRGRKMEHRYLTLKLSDDLCSVEMDQRAPRDHSFEQMAQALPANDCRWVIFDFEWDMIDPATQSVMHKNKLGFITWAPDVAHVRRKMVFASTTGTIRKALSFNAPAKHCSDASDLVREEVLQTVRGTKHC